MLLPEQADEQITVTERRGFKKGLYLVPSLFTVANIAMGFFAVMETMQGFQLLGAPDAARIAPKSRS